MARRFVGRPAKKIDFKSWSFMPAQVQAVTAAATFVPSGVLAFSIPGTILRCRVNIMTSFNATGLTAGDNAEVIFGLGLFSTDAVVAGAGSLPDPAAEPEFPWLWFGSSIMVSPNADHAAAMAQQLLVVDSKAMRKFKPGETLAWVGQYVNDSGNPALNIAFGRTRVLIGT